MTAQYQVQGGTAATICASVESGVRRGLLAPGQALPPVRVLADQLQISAGTVAAAYRSLRQRGVVETAGRNGTRIRPRPSVAPARLARRPPVPPGVLDLSTGGPDPRLLPDPARWLRAIAAEHSGPTGYQDGGVLPELAEAARRRLANDGVPAPALGVTSGALDGLDRLLAAHLRPGDRVGVEDPGWANLLDLVAALGLTPVPVPVDADGPTPAGLTAGLAAGIGALVLTTRAHNPTGATVSAARAAALRRILRGHPDVLVIEDDHAAELATEAPHPLAGAAGPAGRWAYLRSVSKPYGPDLRLAVLAGDATTLSRVEGRQRLGAGWVSTVLQRLVLRMWAEPAVAASVARARQAYQDRRTGLCTALAHRGVPATGATGLNVWVPVPDETLAVTRLRESGYAVAPGSLYRLGSAPGIRITISPLDRTGIAALADAVAAALAVPPRAAPSA